MTIVDKKKQGEKNLKKRVQFLRLNLFYYIYICLIYV